MGTAESVEGTDSGERRGEGAKESPRQKVHLPEEFTRRFEVVAEIGKGSFGCVYKVKDTKTKGVYAAKHLQYNSSNIKEARELPNSTLHVSHCCNISYLAR